MDSIRGTSIRSSVPPNITQDGNLVPPPATDGDYPFPGRPVGLWRLTQGIGRGGMGEVYRSEYDYRHLLPPGTGRRTTASCRGIGGFAARRAGPPRQRYVGHALTGRRAIRDSKYARPEKARLATVACKRRNWPSAWACIRILFRCGRFAAAGERC